METTATNPLAAFQAYQAHMNPLALVEKRGRFETMTTITGGTRAQRLDAICVRVRSQKGARVLRNILQDRPVLDRAAKIEVVLEDSNFLGRTLVNFYRLDGSVMYAEYIGVGPKGGIK